MQNSRSGPVQRDELGVICVATPDLAFAGGAGAASNGGPGAAGSQQLVL
jgi:hypothetical protein